MAPGRTRAARVGGATPRSRLSVDTYLPCAGEALPSCASRAGSSLAFGVAADLAVEQPSLRIPHKCSARSPGRGIAYATRLHDLYPRKQTDRRSERCEVHMRKRVIDIDPTQIGRRHPVTIGAVGNIRATLEALLTLPVQSSCGRRRLLCAWHCV
jgi:hypothetical protein